MLGIISFINLVDILSCPELFLLFNNFSVSRTISSVMLANMKFSFKGLPKYDSKFVSDGGISEARLLPIDEKKSLNPLVSPAYQNILYHYQ